MNKILIMIMLFVFDATGAYAASDSHRKAAEDVLNSSGLKASMNKVIIQMVEIQLNQKPNMQPYKHILLKFFKKHLGYENIKYDFIDIYTEEFTEKELKDISVFYKTPTGKKTISKMPALMQKGAQVGISKVKLHIGELKKMIEDEVKKNSPKQKETNVVK